MAEREISLHYSHQNAVSEFYYLLKNAYGHGPCFLGIVIISNLLRISEKSDFPCDRNVLVFPVKKKKTLCSLLFFFFFSAASM